MSVNLHHEIKDQRLHGSVIILLRNLVACHFQVGPVFHLKLFDVRCGLYETLYAVCS